MKKIFSFFYNYLNGFRLILVLYIGLSIINSGISIILPQISGRLIDYLVDSTTSSLIIRFTLLFLGISIIKLIVEFLSDRICLILQTKISFKLNRHIISHIQRLPFSFFHHQDLTSLTKKVNVDSNTIVSFCIGTIQNMIINAFVLFMGFFMIWDFSALIVFVLICLIVIYFFSYMLMSKKVYSANYEYKEIQALFFSRLHEQLKNIEFLKLQALMSSFHLRLESALDQLYAAASRNQIVMFLFSSLDKLLKLSSNIIIFVIGGNAVIKGTMTIGHFTIITSYCALMLNSIRYFFNLGKNTQTTLVSYNRLKEILDKPAESNGKVVIHEINTIRIQGLSFSYDKEPILQDVSLELNRGKVYALVGNNGSGKSTLMKIVSGLYVNEMSGHISINDILIDEIDMYSLRASAYGISEQEPLLINDTIEYNLYFNKEKSNRDLELFNKLVTLLGLTEFFNRQHNGLNTMINERNDNLSGGEKQKLSLLRSFLKDPQVLILDEPTSALDSDSKARLIEYINSMREKKITIVISHDMDLIKIADHIIRFPIVAE